MLDSGSVLGECVREELSSQMSPTEQASRRRRTMFKHGKANNYLQTRGVEAEAHFAPLAWSGKQRTA